mgnify:CR=1 FL=1
MRNRQPGQIADIFAQRKFTADMFAQHFIGVILGNQALPRRFKSGNITGRPPIGQTTMFIIFGPLIVEVVADFMADDRANTAIIDRCVGVGVKEGRLQYRRREHNFVHRKIGIGIDRHRRHAPFPTPHRAAQFANLIIMFELRGTPRIAEQMIGSMRLDIPGALAGGARVNFVDNSVGKVFYTDLSLRAKVNIGEGRKFEPFVTINNLFDKDPPLIPGTVPGVNMPTNIAVYDIVGRAFTAGVRVKF